MFKVLDKQTPAIRKLVLGFDAGCGTCSDLAGRVQKRVGDKLSVENLNDPKLLSWREEALGKDAKWAPTLFEVDGEKVVRAWAGWKMGWALSRKLGPAITWQVMQALGEVGAAPRIENSPIVEKLPEKAAEAVGGMSRGRFIKGVSGAALAMSVLSGTSALTPLAAATTRKPSPYDSVRRVKITGSALQRLAHRVAVVRDTRNVAGNTLSTSKKIADAKPKAVAHTLRNGIRLIVVTYVIRENQNLVYYEFGRATELGPAVQTRLWQPQTPGSKKSILVSASEAGQLWHKSGYTPQAQGGGVQPLAYCPPIGGGTSTNTHTGCWGNECCEIDWGCALNFVGDLSTCGAAAFVTGPAAPFAIGACLAFLGSGTIELARKSCCSSCRNVWRSRGPCGPCPR